MLVRQLGVMLTSELESMVDEMSQDGVSPEENGGCQNGDNAGVENGALGKGPGGARPGPPTINPMPQFSKSCSSEAPSEFSENSTEVQRRNKFPSASSTTQAGLMVQGSNTWAVDNEIEAITTAEVLERHDALVLVAVEDHGEMVRPLEREWRMGAQADVLSCRNAAGVRTPPRTGASESDYEAAKCDLTRALTRLLARGYKRAVFDRRLLFHPDKRFRALVEEAQLYRGVGVPPSFFMDRPLDTLMAKYFEDFDLPVGRGITYMAWACGVGGGALGALGAGADPDKMVLNDVCQHRCKLLKKRFPRANVIPGDISKREVQSEFLKYKRKVDVLEMSLNCQPSSDAASEHDPEDKRHELNDVAAELAGQLLPRVMVVEDVVGFRHNQPKAYEGFLGKLRELFGHVEVLVTNARQAMVAQNRNRLFIVCTKCRGRDDGARKGSDGGVDLTLVRRQLLRQRTCAARTHPTMREALAPYRANIADFAGVFVPHLRKAKRGNDGRPRRIMSLDRHSPTITSIYGVRGGLSSKCYARYQPCDADVCGKDKCVHLDGALWGVLLGFGHEAPWDTAQSCDCIGCTTPAGRSRGKLADIERGNAIVPAQALLLYRPLFRALRGSRAPTAAVAQTGMADDPHAEDDAAAIAQGGAGVQSSLCCGGAAEGHMGAAEQQAKETADDEPVAKRGGGTEVSLGVAEEFVMWAHRVRGHRPIDLIKHDLRSGTMAGPFITDGQFAEIKRRFRCATCSQALAQFTVKGHLHLWAEDQPKPAVVLAEVEVDVSGRLACPSLPYIHW